MPASLNCNGMIRHLVKPLSIALFMAMVAGCGGGGDDGPGPTTKVYKSRGTVQCENTGVSPATMQTQLTQANIPVLSLACGISPGGSLGLCGSGTAEINIFEIPETDVAKAQSLSFRLFNELLLPPNTPPDIGREVPCPA